MICWQKRIRLFIGILLLFSLCHSCTQVKEYQKAHLNDDEMQLSDRKVESIEGNFESYREAASGAESGKTGGGCGCN